MGLSLRADGRGNFGTGRTRLLSVGVAIVFGLVTMQLWRTADLRPLHANTNGIQMDDTFERQQSSPFLTPALDALVRGWEGSSISVPEARRAIQDIIRSPAYIQHRPHPGIVFVKTHKTASSTVASVLHALATSHNLTTPIPIMRGKQFDARTKGGRSELLRLPTTVVGQKGAPYDIWVNHVLFGDALLRDAVPTSEGKYFSIVRDPATRMRSACNFFGCCPAKSDTEWQEFVLNSTQESWKGTCSLDQSFSEINEGPLSYETYAAMEDRIKRGGLLLLVTERFSESMLALWDFYRLHPLDVAFLSKKVANNTPTRGGGGVADSRRYTPLEDKTTEFLKAEEKVRWMSPYDTATHKLANAQLSEKMEGMFSKEVNKERVKDTLNILNDLLHEVFQGLDDVMPELKFWCLEKELDNVQWSEAHLNMLKGESN